MPIFTQGFACIRRRFQAGGFWILKLGQRGPQGQTSQMTTDSYGSHTPHRKQTCKRKYLLIWELVLLKHAFGRQERGERSADLAVNRIVYPGVLCSIGMGFAPQHGSNSSPTPNNWGFWFSLKWILTALYRPFSFLITVETFTKFDWEEGHIYVVSSLF